MTRLGFVDSARGMAVVLAMLAHALSQFTGGIPEFWRIQEPALLFTRTATPTFMILFGIMIEVVYLRKLREGVAQIDMKRRLLGRLITCYLLFCAITLAAFLTGKLTPGETVLAMLYLDGGRFGVILKIYAMLFAIILVTLSFAERFGSLFYVVVALYGWALKYALVASDLPSNHFISFISGHGNGFGPAILVGMTLVAFGTMIGEAFTGRRHWIYPLAVLTIALAIILSGVITQDPVDFIRYTIKGARWANEPAYFAYGIVACSVSLAFFALIWGWRKRPASRVSFSSLGRDTLFFYGFGNIAINLLPVYEGPGWQGLFYAVAFVLALCLITLAKAPICARINTHAFGLLQRLDELYNDLNKALVGGILSISEQVRGGALPNR